MLPPHIARAPSEIHLHRRSNIIGFLLVSLVIPARLLAKTKPALLVRPAPATQPFVPKLQPRKIDGGYAVVVSKATVDNAGWAKVVNALKQKYGSQAKVFVWGTH